MYLHQVITKNQLSEAAASPEHPFTNTDKFVNFN